VQGAIAHSTVELHWQGKFRGPDFAPMYFLIHREASISDAEAWAHRCNNAEAADYWRRCQSEWAARARRWAHSPRRRLLYRRDRTSYGGGNVVMSRSFYAIRGFRFPTLAGRQVAQ
jgi:hypothetical protein